MTRRENLLAILPAFAVYALLGEAKALAAPRRSSPASWIDGHQSIAAALSAGRISGPVWCSEVERLAREVDLPALMELVNRSDVRPPGQPNHNDPQKRSVHFLDESGQPQKLHYGVALFRFDPSNVITPHGHKNMVSAHMVIEGALRVRNFDRVGDTDGAMIIKPTHDYVANVGHVSTMCFEKNNIHWFVPHDVAATTFDVIIDGLDPSMPDYDIKTIDPVRGKRNADGTIEAPIISFEESSRRFPATV